MESLLLAIGAAASALSPPPSAMAHTARPASDTTLATRAQLDRVTAAVARYRDFAVAQREGWRKFGGDEPLMGEHWFNPKGPDYQGSAAQLDFERPSNLMYIDIGGRRVLTGVRFNMRLATCGWATVRRCRRGSPEAPIAGTATTCCAPSRRR